LVSFYKRQTRQFVEQQRQFQQLTMASPDQYIKLSSLKLAHVLTSAWKPFTLAESVANPSWRWHGKFIDDPSL